MAGLRRPAPEAVLAAARQFESGAHEPVTPRDAATVVLMRPGAAGPEVYIMVRRESMAFAAGAAVFPGGGVSPSDALELPAGWAERMGCPAEQAGAVVAAAVRELEEETGVVLAPTDLGLWDAWTTPVFEPRRYRTWFFTAVLPEGQEARELSTESSSTEWVTPSEAVARVTSGAWRMLPPTYLNCRRLATYSSVEEVMAATATSTVSMFTPTLVGETLTTPAWADALLGDA
jgi:8-oxo-dGTP pyrophosphatase MutT (NUDIX family)